MTAAARGTRVHGTTAIRTEADIAAIEREPIEARVAGTSTTYALLARQAATSPDAPALTFVPTGDPADGGATLTYRELLADVARFANVLSGLGIGPSETVSYVLPNVPETHVVLWAAEAVGIVNPINPFLEVDHMAAILEAANARILVALGPTGEPGIWEKIEILRGRVPSLRAIVRVGGPGPCPPWALDFAALLANASDAAPLAATRRPPDDTASYFHTGGTTGLPKIAKRSQRNEVANAWALATVADLGSSDTILCGLPLFHSNAMMVTGLAPFSVGAHVVMLSAAGYRDPRVVASFWRSVAHYRATLFSAVPTVLSALLAVDPAGADLSSLRFAICGAAPLSAELFGRFERATGLKILEGYGMTEATCVSSLNPRDGDRRIGSIGLRLPYQEMKVARVDERRVTGEVPVDEIGTIVLRGPFVFAGYVESEADRGIVLADGWLNTGDLGRRDADGYFWLTGRAKDLIIRGGHNIDPATIEEGLMRHPAVELAAAVGKPDGHAGELPVVFVTLRPGDATDAKTLLEHARATISERAAVPVDVFVLDAMPMTAVNKIFKPELRRRATSYACEAIVRAACDPIDVRATTEPHDRYGTLTEIVATLAPGAEREALVARAEDALARLPIHWTTRWA
jgi:fatty-acyl-CoA synthase